MLTAEELKTAGFSDDEISLHQEKANLRQAGFSNIEVDDYFNKSVDEDPRLYGIPEGASEPTSTTTGKPLRTNFGKPKEKGLYAFEGLEPKTDFIDRLKSSWKTGVAQSDLGQLRYRQLLGEDTDEIKRQIVDLKKARPKPDKVKRGLPERAVQAAAEMLPIQISGLKKGSEKGLKLGAGFAGIAALAGQAGPQAATPEEIFTIPASFAGGYGVGMLSGTIENIGQIEAGLAYDELLDLKDDKGNRIDPVVAKAAAGSVGVINGLIEMAQIRLLLKTIPGGEALLRGAINKTLKKAVTSKTLKAIALKHAGKYAGFIGAETGQEVLQESTNILATEIAKEVTNELRGTDLPATTINEISNRLVETAKQSALAFSVMGMPGTAVSGISEAITKKPSPVFEGEVTTEAAAPSLSSMIEKGMSTGTLDPAYAISYIQEGYADGSIPIEDVRKFHEAYPVLQEGLNEIIGADLAAKVDEEASPTAKDILTEGGDITARDLLTGKALTTAEKTRESARVFEEEERKAAEISAETFERELTEDEKVRARAEIETDLNKFMRRARPEEVAEEGQIPEDLTPLIKGPKDEALRLADNWNKIWAAGATSVPDEMMIKAKALAAARPDLIALVRNMEDGVEMMTPEEFEKLPPGQGFVIKPETKLRKAPTPQPVDTDVSYKPIIPGKKPFKTMGAANAALKKRGLSPTDHTIIEYEGGFAIQKFGRKLKAGPTEPIKPKLAADMTADEMMAEWNKQATETPDIVEPTTEIKAAETKKHLSNAANAFKSINSILGEKGVLFEGVDEGKWEKIKPLLKVAFDEIMAAGKSGSEFVAASMKNLSPKGKDYFERFVREEMGKPAEKAVDLPDLTESIPALSFGLDATPEQIEALKKRRETGLAKVKELMSKDPQAASNAMLVPQMAQEALTAKEYLKANPKMMERVLRYREGIKAKVEPVKKVAAAETISKPDLGLLRYNKGNQWNEGEVEGFRESIRKGEKIEPVEIVLGDKGEIYVVDGHHRARAAQLEGIKIPYIESGEDAAAGIGMVEWEDLAKKSVEPLIPKLPKQKPKEPLTEQIKGKGIPDIAWEYDKQFKKDFATPDQAFWDWYERYPGRAKGLTKEFGIKLDKNQKGEWYLAKKAEPKSKEGVKPEPKKESWKMTKEEFYGNTKRPIPIQTEKASFDREMELEEWGERIGEKYPTFGKTDKEVNQWIANIRRNAITEYQEALDKVNQHGKDAKRTFWGIKTEETYGDALRIAKQKLENSKIAGEQISEIHKKDKVALHIEGKGWMNPDIIKRHKSIIKQALKEGKPVPENVLAEYPELTKEPVKAPKTETLDSLNPTGGVFVEYSPESRASMKLGKNMTTLDKTSGKSPNDIITIYRGAPKEQAAIVPGDYVTTNKQLAKDYAGSDTVIEKEVAMSDVLDDSTDPLGEEYIYRPKTLAKAPEAETAITESYAKISKGEGGRVRLSEMFADLDISHEEFSKTLREMQLDGQLVMNPLDWGTEITAADRKFAVKTDEGDQHIVYWKGEAKAKKTALDILTGEVELGNVPKGITDGIGRLEQRNKEVDSLIEDWSSREYKKHGGDVEVGSFDDVGDTPWDPGTKKVSIDKINETRRKNKIEHLRSEKEDNILALEKLNELKIEYAAKTKTIDRGLLASYEAILDSFRDESWAKTASVEVEKTRAKPKAKVEEKPTKQDEYTDYYPAEILANEGYVQLDSKQGYDTDKEALTLLKAMQKRMPGTDLRLSRYEDGTLAVWGNIKEKAAPKKAIEKVKTDLSKIPSDLNVNTDFHPESKLKEAQDGLKAHPENAAKILKTLDASEGTGVENAREALKRVDGEIEKLEKVLLCI